MNLSNFSRMLFLTLMILTGTMLAQDLYVHEMIGASKNTVVKKYGQPVHQDNSIPSMDCLFYKTPAYSLTIVLNSDGVYQVEENINYGSKKEAADAIDKIISGSLEKNYSVDTVSATAYELNKQGVKADLQMFTDQISKKFMINIKAKKSY